MDKKSRLKKAFALEKPDRPPILGGWMASQTNIQALTGCSQEEYWSDPFYWGLQMERLLGSDGLIEIYIPVSQNEFRFIDQRHYQKHTTYDAEKVIEEIEALPDPQELWSKFNEESEYQKLVADLEKHQVMCNDILWCPADWDLVPRALCYYEYGYENALTALALYPERYSKWIRYNAVISRQKAIVYARAVKEGIHPGVILSGEDLNFQHGPLVAPEFLRRELFPLIEYALEPFYQAGGKIVLHCDGDYRILLSDMLAVGITGLQGFQSECGMDLEWITKLRTRTGDQLLIFGPLSVTGTLLNGSPEDIRAEVQKTMDICREQASLVFLTSNTINPDVPLENIKTFWQAVLDSRW